MKTTVQTITTAGGFEAIFVGATRISLGGIATSRMLAQCDTYRLIRPRQAGEPYLVQGVVGEFVVFNLDLPRLTKAAGAKLEAEFTRIMSASGCPLTSASKKAGAAR